MYSEQLKRKGGKCVDEQSVKRMKVNKTQEGSLDDIKLLGSLQTKGMYESRVGTEPGKMTKLEVAALAERNSMALTHVYFKGGHCSPHRLSASRFRKEMQLFLVEHLSIIISKAKSLYPKPLNPIEATPVKLPNSRYLTRKFTKEIPVSIHGSFSVSDDINLDADKDAEFGARCTSQELASLCKLFEGEYASSSSDVSSLHAC